MSHKSNWLVLSVLVGLCALASVTLAPETLFAVPLLLGAATLTTDIDEAMKVIFAEPLVNQVVADAELVSIFETEMNIATEQTTGGRYIEMAHFFRLPAGVGARKENEYIPEPDDPLFRNSRIELKKILGSIEMSGDVMRRVRHDEGAFLNYVEQALPSLVTRLTNELDRMYIGFGAGIKARVNDASPTATDLGIDSALGVTGYDHAWLQFLEGERVVFSANANGNPLRSAGAGQSAVVVDIDEANSEIDLSNLPTGVADNDYIFAGDEAGAASQDGTGSNREIAGLLAAIDDGGIVDTYNNIQRSAAGNRLWKAIVINAAVAPWNGALSEDLLLYADDEVSIKGGGKIDYLCMSRSASRGYWKSLKGDRTFPNALAYTGGTQGTARDRGLRIALGDRIIPLLVARKLPPQVVFGIQSDTFKRITLGRWEWDDTTGSIWNRVTDATGRKDAFYATGYLYEELFCTQPRKNFRIDGLNTVQ